MYKQLLKYPIILLFMCTSLFILNAEEALYVDANSNVAVTHTLAFDSNGNGVDSTDSTYDAMPVGAIIMFDGDGWVDNQTIPGWYACTQENAENPPSALVGIILNIPNLEDNFIAGTAPESREAALDDRFGGTNDLVLSVEQLPAHTHSIDHDHESESFTTRPGGAHGHTLASGNWRSGQTDGLAVSGGGSIAGRDTDTPRTGWYGGFVGGGEHSHTIDINLSEYIGDSGSTGEGEVIDNRPAFYTVIYIRKCYQPIN